MHEKQWPMQTNRGQAQKCIFRAGTSKKTANFRLRRKIDPNHPCLAGRCAGTSVPSEWWVVRNGSKMLRTHFAAKIFFGTKNPRRGGASITPSASDKRTAPPLCLKSSLFFWNLIGKCIYGLVRGLSASATAFHAMDKPF